jgi:molybdenum cofactor guanylyltransferase
MLYGLVLMGGQSSRMGRDKSGIVYHDKPQCEHLTDLLARFCENVYWSVNQQQYDALTYPQMLLDTYPQAGPLGGLLTALGTYPEAAWLVVPCDLPNLDAATLGTLVTGRNPQAVATAFWDSDHSGPEPLVSLWESAAGRLLRDFFEKGNRSPRRFLVENKAWLLDAPDARVFENRNA